MTTSIRTIACFALLFLLQLIHGEPSSLFDFQVEDIDGNMVSLSTLKDSVSLVINVASLCGFTESGYQNLGSLYDKYNRNEHSFHVLAFPSNEFGNQEPWTEQEIKHFATSKYDATFPMFTKVNVNGPNTHPLFNFLKSRFPGDVAWNFHGIWLINKDGVPVHRFASPDWKLIDEFVSNELSKV